MTTSISPERDYWVTACGQCLTACCWHGVFMCDRSQSADVKKVKASKLQKLKKEHPSHYSPEALQIVCGNVDYV